MVERHLAKVEVAGSSPVIRSKETAPKIGCCFYFFGGVRARIEFLWNSGSPTARKHSRLGQLFRLPNTPCFARARQRKQSTGLFPPRLPVIRSKNRRLRKQSSFSFLEGIGAYTRQEPLCGSRVLSRLLLCRIASPRYTRLALLATRDIASQKTIINRFVARSPRNPSTSLYVKRTLLAGVLFAFYNFFNVSIT